PRRRLSALGWGARSRARRRPCARPRRGAGRRRWRAVRRILRVGRRRWGSLRRSFRLWVIGGATRVRSSGLFRRAKRGGGGLGALTELALERERPLSQGRQAERFIAHRPLLGIAQELHRAQGSPGGIVTFAGQTHVRERLPFWIQGATKYAEGGSLALGALCRRLIAGALDRGDQAEDPVAARRTGDTLGGEPHGQYDLHRAGHREGDREQPDDDQPGTTRRAQARASSGGGFRSSFLRHRSDALVLAGARRQMPSREGHILANRAPPGGAGLGQPRNFETRQGRA